MSPSAKGFRGVLQAAKPHPGLSMPSPVTGWRRRARNRGDRRMRYRQAWIRDHGGYYRGPVDGIYSSDLGSALAQCACDRHCLTIECAQGRSCRAARCKKVTVAGISARTLLRTSLGLNRANYCRSSSSVVMSAQANISCRQEPR